MALAHYQGYVENVSTGKALPDAVIRVYSFPANVLQSTFADPSSTPKPVVSSDANGAFNFYIPDGVYDLEYVYNGDVLTRLTNIPIYNPANALPAAKLAASGGSALVGFLQSGAGAVARTAQAKSREVVSPEDFGAVGNGTTDDTAALQSAITYAATFGAEVHCKAACYKTTAKITLPKSVTLRGRGFGFATAQFKPAALRDMGTQIYKAHNGTGIEVVGTGAYSTSAGMYGIVVTSDYDLYATGDGFVIDQVGTYNIEHCQAWSCGGHGFTVGVTAGDVTGHVILRRCYVNNCTGRAYNIRAKWMLLDRCLSDGCTHGAYFDNAPDGMIQNCHFEGFTTCGVRFANANSGTRFTGKNFIASTNAGAARGVQIDNVAGNSLVDCSGIKIQGPCSTTAITFTGALVAATSATLTVAWAGTTGSYGIYFSDGSIKTVTLTNASTAVSWTGAVTATASAKALSNPTFVAVDIVGAGALGAKVHNAEINNAAIGVSNNATSVDVTGTYFFACGIPISSNGASAKYKGNRFDTTTGVYTIDHVSGNDGTWTENFTDKPFKPTVTGVIGDYGTNKVKDNPGFKTRTRIAANITSGVAFNPGMDAVPDFVSFMPYVAGMLEPAWVSSAAPTAVTANWASGGTIGMIVISYAKCEMV